MNRYDEQFGTEIDEIIHAPARLIIMATLGMVEKADFAFLLKYTGLTRGNLSSHLSKLEDAKYVEIEKKFVDKVPRTMIKLSKKGQERFVQYREDMKQILDF